VLDLLQIVRPFKEQSMFSLSPETRDKLQGVSTATLASALQKIGLGNEMVQDMHSLTRSRAAAWWGRPIRCATCRRESTSTLGLYPPTDEANLIAFASWQKQNRVT
jgi:hypothetical protein